MLLLSLLKRESFMMFDHQRKLVHKAVRNWLCLDFILKAPLQRIYSLGKQWYLESSSRTSFALARANFALQ